MTEMSGMWETITGTGDGANSYTQDQANELMGGMEHDPLSPNQGVIPDSTGRLAVSGVISPLRIAEGNALVEKLKYTNTGAITLAVDTPTADTAYRVVVAANWATKKTRIGLVSAGNGNTTLPNLVQNPGTLWQIPLASFVIDSAGSIWTNDEKEVSGVKDDRHFMVSPSALLVPVYTEELAGDRATVNFPNIQGDVSCITIIASLRVDKANVAEADVGINVKIGGSYTYMINAFEGDGTTSVETDGSFSSGQSQAQFISMPAQDAPAGYFGILIARLMGPGFGFHMPLFIQGASFNGLTADDTKLIEGYMVNASEEIITQISVYADAPFADGSHISVYIER